MLKDLSEKRRVNIASFPKAKENISRDASLLKMIRAAPPLLVPVQGRGYSSRDNIREANYNLDCVSINMTLNKRSLYFHTHSHVSHPSPLTIL